MIILVTCNTVFNGNIILSSVDSATKISFQFQNYSMTKLHTGLNILVYVL